MLVNPELIVEWLNEEGVVEIASDFPADGDLFAAGFLFGLARGASYRSCGELGALAANEVIQHLGARPETSLKALAASRGIRVPA